PRGLRRLFAAIMGRQGEARTELVQSVLRGSERHVAEGGEFAAECTWALRLAAAYPGDAGMVVALLLNLMRLERGQAIYLAAGNLHSYLRGVGVEIMANSDNVLRGGLTPKHVDVPELLRVLSFDDGPALAIEARGSGPESIYSTPAEEFRLSRVVVGPHGFRAAERRGPEILLTVEGGVTVRGVPRAEVHELPKGASLFVPANAPEYDVAGQGVVFRATVGKV
ncbi:MAG TPA: mannose-6-phosphate isomerase, class I, partial [Polyangiaceae bacterium]|nr:mannose-6-phosphate isomerase, class I [Polyangiaceae bacterium]